CGGIEEGGRQPEVALLLTHQPREVRNDKPEELVHQRLFAPVQLLVAADHQVAEAIHQITAVLTFFRQCMKVANLAVQRCKRSQLFGADRTLTRFQLLDQGRQCLPVPLVERFKLPLFHCRPTMLLAICLMVMTGSSVFSTGSSIPASSL